MIIFSAMEFLLKALLRKFRSYANSVSQDTFLLMQFKKFTRSHIKRDCNWLLILMTIFSWLLGDDLYFWLKETRIHQVCCHHPNVLNMMKAWQDERHLYMAFEFCPQGTLGDLIRFALASLLKTSFLIWNSFISNAKVFEIMTDFGGQTWNSPGKIQSANQRLCLRIPLFLLKKRNKKMVSSIQLLPVIMLSLAIQIWQQKRIK